MFYPAENTYSREARAIEGTVPVIRVHHERLPMDIVFVSHGASRQETEEMRDRVLRLLQNAGVL